MRHRASNRLLALSALAWLTVLALSSRTTPDQAYGAVLAPAHAPHLSSVPGRRSSASTDNNAHHFPGGAGGGGSDASSGATGGDPSSFWPGGGYPHQGSGGGGGGDSSNNNGGGLGPFGGGGDGGGGGADRAAGFDIELALAHRRIHGILATLAMVLLFPLGAILLRVLPAGRPAVWTHVAVQLLAWGVYVAAAGLGIDLVVRVRIPEGGGLLQNPSTRYHPIIGLVLLALLVIQPVVGFVHHRVYKRVQRRQLWSYLHLAIGRVGITLGIINGGLGLYLANASASAKRVYAIVPAIMWALWMLVALWSEIRRLRKMHRDSKSAAAKSKHPVTDGRSSE